MKLELQISKFIEHPDLIKGIRALAELTAVLLAFYMAWLYFQHPWDDQKLVTLCYTNQPMLESIQNGSLCIQSIPCTQTGWTNHTKFNLSTISTPQTNINQK